MRHVLAGLSALVVMACGQGGEGAAAQEGDWSRDQIEEVVREYILENPEIIEDALIELQRRAREREQQALFDNVASASAALFEDARDPVVGADNPEVTIVEFFDYKCGYCRRSNAWVQDAIEEHGGQVRFVFKEFPVLGPESVEAARASLAVWNTQPEHYLAFHNAMMNASGPLPGERIEALAMASGVDVEQMREAMNDPRIEEHIGEVRDLAQQIGVTGTPFFVVGETVIPGADIAALERALNEALEG